jgi:hypothetical protein
LVNDSKPLVTQSKEVTKKQYSGGKNTPGGETTNGGLGWIKAEDGKNHWSFTFTEKGANKSAQASQYNKIILDTKTGVISIKGKKYTGKSYDEAKLSYDRAMDGLAEAKQAILETKKANGDKKSKAEKTADTKSVVNMQSLVDKSYKDLNKLDSWEEVTLNSNDNDAEVLRILGTKDYDEARKMLSKGEQSTTDELPSIDELPDLPN